MFTFFCGIDISKDSFHATLIDKQGKPLFSFPFPMSSEGFHSFLLSLRSHCPSLENLLLGMESSGSYYLNFFSFLQVQGLDVRLLNPLLVSNFAKLSLRKTKTDKRDATTIAHFLRANAPSLAQAHPAADELRLLARARENISSHIVSLKNEIKRYLAIVFPEILRLLNPFTASSLRLLAAFPSKDAILQASPQVILKTLLGDGRGRKPLLSPQLLIKTARTSIGLASPNLEAILRSKIRILQSLQKELEDMTTRLVQCCHQQAPRPLTILNSIQGLNTTTVSHFLAETHGRCFPTPQKLIAYAGLDPAIYESGQWKGQGHISKRGNKSLRRVLFLMAVGVIRVNPTFQQVYSKKRAEGKRYKQAVLVVAHKLLRVIHALLRYQIPFNQAHLSL